MTYTNPSPDPYPQATSPAEWLEIAYDNGWMHRNSTTANRGYLANFREDHRQDECNNLCGYNADAAKWPGHPTHNRHLGPTTNGSELFQQLMSEELATLSPLLVEVVVA